jgi:hypothetical protein
MTASTNTLERMLIDDLAGLGDALADDGRLVPDLYRALASRRLVKDGVDGHLALSWRRAEEVVDEARAAAGLPPVEGLAQSGGEGEVTARAAEALERLGWRSLPARTDEHDERHVWDPESPPPRDETPPEWERLAHDEAERSRARQGGTGQAIPRRQ